MRDEYQPGDLSIRIGFARGYGADSGKVHPKVEITDQTSGLHVELQLTAEQLVDMLGGSEAQVPAAKVSGYRGVRNWGKYLHIKTATVKTKPGDYKLGEADPRELPHVAEAVAEIEAAGYRCDTPRRNNGQQWVIVGRRYDDTPTEGS
jgi:hypothetical protein